LEGGRIRSMVDDLRTESSLMRIEEGVRRFWRRYGIPEAALAARRSGVPYTIWLQPLPAAGQPWIDRLRLLVTGDLFARFQAMRGTAVCLQTAWACHGLAVELEVEASLPAVGWGYDLAALNAACRERVTSGITDGEALAESLGAWLEPAHTGSTMAPQAISVVWNALRELYDAGRLRCERRLVSVCGRCRTPLSTAEATRHQVHADAQAAWVLIPWEGEAFTYFLTWVEAPWTLLGMVGLAIHPDATYVVVEPSEHQDDRKLRLVLAEQALSRTLLDDKRVIRQVTGRGLRKARYQPLFTFVAAIQGASRPLLSTQVPLDTGTGLLAVSPSFEPHSLAIAEAHGLPLPQVLDDRGNLNDLVRPWRGLSPFQAEALILEELEARGLLYRQETRPRTQAHCPYCGVRLVEVARPAWVIEAPEDPWVVGRDRPWGIPLPIWACEACGTETCVASRDDLAHRIGLDSPLSGLHRPEIDAWTFPCPSCGSLMRRVEAVVDAAFEQALLPALSSAPSGPADLAVGLGGESAGWWADITTLAGMLARLDRPAQIVALSEAAPAADWASRTAPPADALRWAAYAGTTAEQAEADFLVPLRDLAAAWLASVPPAAMRLKPPGDVCELGRRWLRARIHQAVMCITEALERGLARRAAQDLTELVAEVARWPAGLDRSSREWAVDVISRLTAPFVPYLAEALHRQVASQPGQSVHLLAWPLPDPSWQDDKALYLGNLAWQVAALGERARAKAGVDPGRLLAQAFIGSGPQEEQSITVLPAFRELLAMILAVEQASPLQKSVPVRWHLTLHREKMPDRGVPAVDIQAALQALAPDPAAALAYELRQGRSASLTVGGRPITLLPDEVRVWPIAQPGWAAAADSDFLVVLDVGQTLA
jgi:isoleucyl-tRNA synthetase